MNIHVILLEDACRRGGTGDGTQGLSARGEPPPSPPPSRREQQDSGNPYPDPLAVGDFLSRRLSEPHEEHTTPCDSRTPGPEVRRESRSTRPG